jgi:hypothetical protein
VIKAESQAVVNTLMAHNFQDAFKKGAQVLGTVHMRRIECNSFNKCWLPEDAQMWPKYVAILIFNLQLLWLNKEIAVIEDA